MYSTLQSLFERHMGTNQGKFKQTVNEAAEMPKKQPHRPPQVKQPPPPPPSPAKVVPQVPKVISPLKKLPLQTATAPESTAATAIPTPPSPQSPSPSPPPSPPLSPTTTPPTVKQGDPPFRKSLALPDSEKVSTVVLYKSIGSEPGGTVALNDLPPGLKNNGYELGKKIGEGGFSTVYLATNSRLPGVQLACKVFRLEELHRGWAEKFLKQEMKLMTKLHHRNICAAYDVYKTRSRGFIFMRYAVNGGLEAYIARHFEEGRLPELPLGRRLFHHLMTGVEYLHSLNVAHRDLKVENFLLDEDLEPMITDFGFSVLSKSDAEVPILCSTVCGSTQYLAPELRLLARGEGGLKEYDAKKADIYSMGVCLFELLHGYRPFEGAYDIRSKELARRQLTGDYRISARLHLSRDCQLVIRALLEPKVTKRPSAKAALKHAWFSGLV